MRLTRIRLPFLKPASIAFVVALACGTVAGSQALGQAQGSTGGWTRGCPPNGYNRAGDCVNHQPAFDHDLDGDGVNDSWDVPLTLPKPNPPGGNYQTTDACGNSVCLVGIPDPRGPGKGSDHYSPRFKKAGGPAGGTEVGQCVYTCGRNTWTLTFVDANGDCQPDKFPKSTWESRDGGTGPGDWPFSGKITTFSTDLTAAKIVPIRTVANNPPPAPFNGYHIQDATIVDFGVPLSGVILDGQPIGFPSDVVISDNVANSVASPPTLRHDLHIGVTSIPIGQPVVAQGLIVNTDPVPHQYQVVFFGVNAGVSSPPPPPMFLMPGAVGGYSVQGVVTGPGTGALIAFAYSENGQPSDGQHAIALFNVTVDPEVACRAGNINTGVGPQTDTLFVNNSAGSAPARIVSVTPTTPLNLRVAATPSNGRRYAMYVWVGPPTASTIRNLPMGVGTICRATPLNPGPGQPVRIANNTGRPQAGSENWPGPNTQQAPYTLLNLPGGLGRTGTFYFQGIQFDPGAPNALAGVTNGIVLISR